MGTVIAKLWRGVNCIGLYGNNEALERYEQYWMFKIECDCEAMERCELHWNAVITKLWRGANSIGCSRLNVIAKLWRGANGIGMR